MSRPAAANSGLLRFADGTLDPSRWKVIENVACLSSVPSSNDLARELVDFYFQEEQSLPATLLVADAQPQARGRNGRRWKAPRGRGIYLTFLRRAAEDEPLSVVPLAVARWLRDALERATGLGARLKWPNDLYVGRKKLGGVLAEARTQGGETYVAVGIGVNVLGPSGTLGAPHATTIEEETGRRAELAGLLQAVVDEIDARLGRPDWEREVAEWQRSSVHRAGDRIRVRVPEGEVEGEYRGIDASGFLELATAGGAARVSSGELEEW